MNTDIIDYVVNEHKNVAALIVQAKQSSDPKLVHKVIEKLSKHSFVEETLLYPVLQNIIADKDPTLKSLHDHAEVKASLLRIMSLDARNTIEFIPAMVHLANLVHAHNVYEESSVLPMFSKCFNRDILVRLGTMAQKLEAVGPSVPDSASATLKDAPKAIAEEFNAVTDLMKHAMNA